MNKELISGIFNYCDRWCERCAFTEHCAIYEEDEVQNELESDGFFHLLESILDDTISMIETYIQAEAPELWQDWMRKIDQKSELSELEEELILLSRKYFMLGRKWRQTHDPLLKERQKEWYEQLKMGLDRRKALDQLEDALAVLQWYQPFIGAKVQRAIQGKNRDGDFELHPYQNDANGSAKIALLAIDRSLSAWEIVRQLIPETTDDMLDQLVLLSKLRSGMQRIFPKTDQFIRPGFDELGEARSDGE